MPTGCFIVEIDSNSKASLKDIYFEEDAEKIEIDDNVILQLKMGHSDKRLSTLLRKDFSIVSFNDKFKKGKEQCEMITGVILKKSDDPTNFREGVKMASSIFIKNFDLDGTELQEKVKEIYDEYFETPSIILNPKQLETRLKDKVKSLNAAGKFDEAKKMLDIIQKVPTKLFEANKEAERAIKSKDYDKAEREFNKAVKFAKQLNEKEIAKGLSDKAKIVKQIPKFMEKRNKALSNAKNALRTDKIENAHKYFREAAELSKKLLDPEGAEEYNLKADCFSQYAAVCKKFKK
ncbi:MAG: hypothetical protein GY870_04775 [archaeon]|nr:hypothetical protein [archaeon]